MTRLLIALCIVIIVVASTLHAQVPAAGGVIIGRVVDIDSGEPIAGARVGINAASAGRTMTGGSASDTVLADSQGRFYFSELTPGTYAVASAMTNSAPFVIQSPARHISINRNQTISNVEVVAMRTAWIAGRVTDEAGQAVAGMSVWAYRRTGVGSQSAFTVATAATTDDRGDYTIDPLPPGEYLVCACQWMAPLLDSGLTHTLGLLTPAQRIDSGLTPAQRPTSVAVDVDANWRPPVRTFHPAAMHPANATLITLRSNEERSDVHIGVTVGALATISGRVIGLPDAMSATAIRLQPVVRTGGPVLSGREADHVDADGSFRFVGVPPGDYTLLVRYRGPDPPTLNANGLAQRLGLRSASAARPGAAPPAQNDISLWSHTPIAVDGRDQVDLQIPVAAALRLPGHVRLSENGAVQPFRANGGRLERLDEPVGDPPIGSSVRADDEGGFELEGVIPGRYRFRWTILPPGLTLKSITFGGRDVTDMPFMIEDGRAPAFEVTLVPNDTATLPGRIITTGTDAPPDAVVAFPADRRLWDEPTVAERRFVRARPSQLGNFTFEDLPPGDYVIAAISARDHIMHTWQTPSRLEALASTGRPLTVVPGDNPAVEIRR